MAHLDCKYLYSSPQLEIAFRNFKWIPLPHELDWYHYSVQFFRVLLFFFLQGVHICFTDCKAANETQKRFVDALNDELWTRQAPATSSSKLICHTLLKWNWCAAMMLLYSFKLCASMLHWKLAIYSKHRRTKQKNCTYKHR